MILCWNCERIALVKVGGTCAKCGEKIWGEKRDEPCPKCESADITTEIIMWGGGGPEPAPTGELTCNSCGTTARIR